MGLAYHTTANIISEQYSTQAMKLRMTDTSDLKGLAHPITILAFY